MVVLGPLHVVSGPLHVISDPTNFFSSATASVTGNVKYCFQIFKVLIIRIFRVMASVLLCCTCEKEIGGGRKPHMFACITCKKPFLRECKPGEGKTMLTIYSIM